MKTTYKISEISKLYNIGLDSLRYYERLGILKPRREANNYRTYDIEDVWKLNMIKDLRLLNFSMEEIKAYLENRTIEGTFALLEKEVALIDRKIAELTRAKLALEKRRASMTQVLNTLPTNTVTEKILPLRKSIILEKSDVQEEEMDLMVKQLHATRKNRNSNTLDHENLQDKLYILGDSVLGSLIHPKDYEVEITQRYSGVFMLVSPEDSHYHSLIPSGNYLSYCYRGGYSNTWTALHKIKAYAHSKAYELEGNAMELWNIDIHETQIVDEFFTEVQVKIKER